MKKAHLKDIDFRTREERSANHVEEIKNWYKEVADRLESDPDCQASYHQLRAFSSVLWLLLPKAEFNKLTKHEKGKTYEPYNEDEYQEQLAYQMRKWL